MKKLLTILILLVFCATPLWSAEDAKLTLLIETADAAVDANAVINTAIRDSLEDANDHLQALRGVNEGFIDENVWTTIRSPIIDFSSATWNIVATHEVFTVTGDVEFEIMAFCSTNCSGTSNDSIWFFQGDAGVTGFRAFSFDLDDADAGENLIPLIMSADPVATVNGGYIWNANTLSLAGGGVWRGSIFMGQDIGYQLDDHVGVAGIIVLYCRWRPINSANSSEVTIGTGVGL